MALSGAGAVASLCPNSVFLITGTIQFNAINQEISTQGYPTDNTRAVIRVMSSSAATAINGSGWSGIRIKNIVVDGNRPQLGWLKGGGALIEVGGPAASAQIVDHIQAFEPLGWSTIHISEGNLDCTGAQITNNQVGPSGQPQPSGNWADGISLACTNSVVMSNVVTDATDGGIVVFQAPGSTISGNTIQTINRTMFGAINMVDYTPYSGNYTGTVVAGNIISANSGFIKIGIGMGPTTWGITASGSNYGGTVTSNTITGTNIGYGLVANGLTNFTVQGNDFSTMVPGGILTKKCVEAENFALPAAFVVNEWTSSGSFQSHQDDAANTAICIAPQYSYGRGQFNVVSGINTPMGSLISVNFQTDGNLVIYDPNNNPLWASNTAGQSCGQQNCTAVFQSDGNFVLYNNGKPYWATNTADSEATDNGKAAYLRFSNSYPYLEVVNGAGGDVFY